MQTANPAPRLALGYLRVSTEAQAGGDRYGLAAQRDAIARYADAVGIRVLGYCEEHESGASTTRPTWTGILNDTDTPHNVVIVAKADRVSRNTEYFYYSKFILKNHGIELLSANSAEDFSQLGALAPVMEAMVVAFAQYERQRISERMTGGRLAKARTGGYAGGRPPFGRRPDGRGGLEPDPGETEALGRIRELIDGGRRNSDICRVLTADGYLPRGGGVWRPSTIAGIRRNKYYNGVYTYAGISAPAQTENMP